MMISEHLKPIMTKLKLYRTRMRMDKDICELISKLDQYKVLSEEEQKYYLLGTSWVRNKLLNSKGTTEGKKYLLDMYQEWDEYGSIPLELGNYIENLVSSKNISCGIHRISFYSLMDTSDIYHNDVLQSIFNDGLKNLGDLSSGVVLSGTVQPSKTVSFFGSMLDAVIHIKTSYKGSKGGILVACPTSLVDKDGNIIKGKEKEVYNIVDNTIFLKPTFLLGFIEQENGVCHFYRKENFLKTDKHI